MSKRVAISTPPPSCSSTVASSSSSSTGSDEKRKKQRQPSFEIEVLLPSGRPNTAAQSVFGNRDMVGMIHKCLFVHEQVALMLCHGFLLLMGGQLEMTNFQGTAPDPESDSEEEAEVEAEEEEAEEKYPPAVRPLLTPTQHEERKEKKEQADKKRQEKEKRKEEKALKHADARTAWIQNRQKKAAMKKETIPEYKWWLDNLHFPATCRRQWGGPRVLVSCRFDASTCLCLAPRWHRTREVSIYNYQCLPDHELLHSLAAATKTSARLITVYSPMPCECSYTAIYPEVFPGANTVLLYDAWFEQLSWIHHPLVERIFIGVAQKAGDGVPRKHLANTRLSNHLLQHLYIDLRKGDAHITARAIGDLAEDTDIWRRQLGQSHPLRIDLHVRIRARSSTPTRVAIRRCCAQLMAPRRNYIDRCDNDTVVDDSIPTINLTLHSETTRDDLYLLADLFHTMQVEAKLGIADYKKLPLKVTYTPRCTIQFISSIGEWNFIGVHPKGNGEFVYVPPLPVHLRVNSAEALAAGQMLLPDDIKQQWRADALAPLPSPTVPVRSPDAR